MELTWIKMIVVMLLNLNFVEEYLIEFKALYNHYFILELLYVLSKVKQWLSINCCYTDRKVKFK